MTSTAKKAQEKIDFREKYLTKTAKNGRDQYALKIGGLVLYFSSIKSAKDYYLHYLV